MSVPDIVSGSRHLVPVTHNSCRSSVYDILLNSEILPVILTGRKRILSVTHEIVPDGDRWPAVISCTGRATLLPFSALHHPVCTNFTPDDLHGSFICWKEKDICFRWIITFDYQAFDYCIQNSALPRLSLIISYGKGYFSIAYGSMT